jgi:hypothetical protein
MKMDIKQSINRSFNLLGTSIVALSGFAFAPEIFLEKEWADRADDIGLLLLGIVAIFWYLKGENRFSRSIAPIVFIVIAFALKVAALMIEFDDLDAVGDDFGGLTLFVLAILLIAFLYWQTKNLLAENSAKK